VDVKICLIDETGAGDGALSVLAARWGLEQDDDNLMALVMTREHLELRKRDEPKLGGIFVDFVGGAMAHRRKFGGGRGEAVAKAVGIKGDYLPDVVDATAGWGAMPLCWPRWAAACGCWSVTRWWRRCSMMGWRAATLTRKSARGCRSVCS
jgi:hypothetical protein